MYSFLRSVTKKINRFKIPIILTGIGAGYLYEKRNSLNTYFNSSKLYAYFNNLFNYSIFNKIIDSLSLNDEILRKILLKSINNEIDENNEKNNVILTIPYIVIGNGTAAYYSAMFILSQDANAKVLIMSPNEFPPYSFDTRNQNAFFISHVKDSAQSPEDVPAKYSFPLFGNLVSFERLIECADSQIISYLINSQIFKIDSDNKILILKSENSYDKLKYNKLIIANEFKAVNPKSIDTKVSDNIMTIDNINDYLNLLSKIDTDSVSICVVGSSMHALSLAYSLKKLKPKFNINLIRDDTDVLDLIPKFLNDKIVNHYEKNNIKVFKNNINNVVKNEDKLILKFNNNNKISSDLIFLFNKKVFDDQFVKGKKCIGKECPELCDNLTKYKLNSDIPLSERSLFIAGDNCYFEDSSKSNLDPSGFEYSYISAKIAGKLAATGKKETNDYLPFKVCNISDNIKFQMIGDCSQDLETTSIWRTNSFGNINSPGLVMYHKDGVIVGMLLWNITNKFDLADEVIHKKTPIDNPVEVAKWFIPKSDSKLEKIEEFLSEPKKGQK